MKLPGYYSSGEFARLAQVSVRTIRFYDKQNILKPSFVSAAGARFYTDSDLARLQQILLLKYLGFSLDDIREMTIGDNDYHLMVSSLNMQKKLVQDRMEQLQLVAEAIDSTVEAIEKEHQLDWSRMLDLIHLTGMEKSLKDQYQNASNISARIRLHREFSRNTLGWFPWIYEQADITDGMKILELGCGNGALWTENLDRLPLQITITLSDISEGMLRDARRNIGTEDARFDFRVIDCHELPFEDNSFDLVIANHVLFYCKDIGKACGEIARVLKPDGFFLSSTYGTHHMKEITELVQAFDNRIVLAAENLYERFGLENGAELLSPHFSSVEIRHYDDCIVINQAEPLIEYILSCHGNQNQILLDRYKDFRTFVEEKVHNNFHITKDAGIFLCRK
ncbi:MAG: methyltransferase domain-containing protein [Lachnospiraceae bacterium]|nr:methyltransferase domain-containing protein [Lachnospiraceae bacterium]